MGNPDKPTTFDLFFRRHQAFGGTQSGKRNEMIGDLVDGSRVQTQTLEKINRQMERQSGISLQERAIEGIKSLANAHAQVGGALRELGNEMGTASTRHEDLLRSQSEDIREQTWAIDETREVLTGLPDQSLSSEELDGLLPQIYALHEKGLLHPTISYRFGSKFEKIRDLTHRYRNAQVEVECAQKAKDEESLNDAIANADATLREYLALSSGEQALFNLFSSNGVPFVQKSTIRRLGQHRMLNRDYHEQLQWQDPTMRQGLTGMNISTIESNEIARRGFQGTISTLEREGGLTRDTLVACTDVTVQAFNNGLGKLGSDLGEEFQVTREVLGGILIDGFSDIGYGLDNISYGIATMTDIMTDGFERLDAVTLNGFNQTIRAFCNEGAKSRELQVKLAGYVAKTIVSGLTALGEEIEYGNNLQRILIASSKEGNRRLDAIAQELITLNQQSVAVNVQRAMEHTTLMQAIGFYHEETERRHIEALLALEEIENTANGIRAEVKRIGDLIESERERDAEFFFTQGENILHRDPEAEDIEDAIESYLRIIDVNGVGFIRHFKALIRLAECNFLIGKFAEALKYARKARKKAPEDPDIREYTLMVETGIMYQMADREEDTALRNQGFRKVAGHFEDCSIQGPVDEFSPIKKFYYAACLYKAGQHVKALYHLASLAKSNPTILDNLLKDTPFGDFNADDQQRFLVEAVIDSPNRFSGSFYGYIFIKFMQNGNPDVAKKVLRKALKHYPADFIIYVEQELKKRIFAIEEIADELLDVIQENTSTIYFLIDLVAIYHLAKKTDAPNKWHLLRRLLRFLNGDFPHDNQELIKLALLLGEDFEEFYNLSQRRKR